MVPTVEAGCCRLRECGVKKLRVKKDVNCWTRFGWAPSDELACVFILFLFL